jgi:RING-box protein 1
MADVDMTDAPSGSTASVKKVVKAKAGASAEGGDGKKRFEVKKVCLPGALVRKLMLKI